MADETPNTVNLDLNLGPVIQHTTNDVNFEVWLAGYATGRRLGRTVPHWPSFSETVPIRIESGNIPPELMGGGGLEVGEGSVAAEERPSEVVKTCENGNGGLEDEVLGEKEEAEKVNGDEGSFFDCNVCLDLASDPVVTCCGHLFCWSCLYLWLHVHSTGKECPVCKGEVCLKNVTPIYGRGNCTTREQDPSLKIPQRPQAKRIEHWRHTIQRNQYSFPIEELIRRISNRFETNSPQVHPVLTEGADNNDVEWPERYSSLLPRIMTSRGLRREQNTVASSEGLADADSTQSTPTSPEFVYRLSPLPILRPNRAPDVSSLSSAERLVDTYFQSHPIERDQEQPPAFSDRDSLSSIVAIIQSDSQTVDNAPEIDSMVSLSTSSSRRRPDPSGVSDVDIGDIPPPRRPRLFY